MEYAKECMNMRMGNARYSACNSGRVPAAAGYFWRVASVAA